MSSLTHTYQPLDYSYQNITTINQLLTCEPHNDSQSDLIQQTKNQLLQNKQLQLDSENQIPTVLRTLNAIRNIKPISNTTEQSKSIELYKREPVITRGIKLCYNTLSSINGINHIIDQLIDNSYTQLKFIDLSYNKLTTIENDILQYSNLTILYLHGNCISSFTELFKLQSLHYLTKLQLHNNPLYDTQLNGGINKPRAYIIGILQQLKVLDCVPISAEERELSVIYVHSFEKKKLLQLKRTAELHDTYIVKDID